MKTEKPRTATENGNRSAESKHFNRKLILSLLRQTGTLSIAELAEKTGLSKTSVAKILARLERRGLALSLGKGASTDVGGKKPERFGFNPTLSHVIPLTLTHNHIIGAVSDLRCNLSCQREVECDTRTGYREVLGKVARLVLDLMRDAALDPDNLCSIVLGCEGGIDAEGGVIRYAPCHPWDSDAPIVRDLGELLPFRVTIRVDNNVRLAGYAHAILNADEYGAIAVVGSYHYAGGCLIEGKQLVRGTNGYVGEFGHMILEPGSEVLCHCGCHGCFGALVAPETVLAEAKKRLARHADSALASGIRSGEITIEDVFAAANREDRLARELVDRSVGYFAQLIHNLTITRDPVKVILQGVYSGAGRYFLDALTERVATLPFYRTRRRLPISFTPIPIFHAYLVGAAYYAVDDFLGNDVLYE